MTAPAFTPGPWYVSEPWAGFASIKRVDDDALVFGIAAGEPEEKQSDEVCEANARLIAAAPELYEAVEALVECFIKRGPFDEPLGSSEQAPSINAGIAALAKARGEQ